MALQPQTLPFPELASHPHREETQLQGARDGMCVCGGGVGGDSYEDAHETKSPLRPWPLPSRLGVSFRAGRPLQHGRCEQARTTLTPGSCPAQPCLLL